jgi:hypothetical protein
VHPRLVPVVPKDGIGDHAPVAAAAQVAVTVQTPVGHRLDFVDGLHRLTAASGDEDLFHRSHGHAPSRGNGARWAGASRRPPPAPSREVEGFRPVTESVFPSPGFVTPFQPAAATLCSCDGDDRAVKRRMAPPEHRLAAAAGPKLS